MKHLFAFSLSLLLLSSACERADRTTSLGGLPGAPRYEQKAGVKAYDFQLTDLAGNPTKLSDHEGKLILLNFWATWCVPCVAEMPSLIRLSQKMEGKPFVIVAVNGDGEKGLVEKFVKKYKIPFPIALDPTLVVAPKYGVVGFPETFFIGPKGEFLAFTEPGSQKESIRVIADREWDSPQFVEMINKLLPAAKDDTGSI